MSVNNYKTLTGVFSLYALRDPENFSDEWIRNTIDRINELSEEFSKELNWHTVSCQSGFYDGLQLYVKCDYPEYEVLDDVWSCFLNGLPGIPEKCGYTPYPPFDSANFNNARMVLNSDSFCASQEQLDEAFGLVRLDVSERYQVEMRRIQEWLEDTAMFYGLDEIISNGSIPIWA